MRDRQRAAENATVHKATASTVLRTRFDRSDTFSEREIVALPAYGSLVRTIDEIIDHHRRASSSRDFAG